jgi:hypothetical protein
MTPVFGSATAEKGPGVVGKSHGASIGLCTQLTFAFCFWCSFVLILLLQLGVVPWSVESNQN